MSTALIFKSTNQAPEMREDKGLKSQMVREN